MDPQSGPRRTGPRPAALRARWRRAGAGALLVILAGLALPWSSARPAAANSDGPLPGFTGGFGEPTCHACHFDAPEEPASGELLLSGVPGTYRPGAEYALTVTLRDRRLERAGFQLTARFAGDGAAAGRQAGRLLAPRSEEERQEERRDEPRGKSREGARAEPRLEVVEHRQPPVLYARQTRAGSEPTTAHEAAWTVTWVAPTEPAGPVLFHAAANAANDDDSELGDVIHLATATSRPAAPPAAREPKP